MFKVLRNMFGLGEEVIYYSGVFVIILLNLM